MLGLRLSTLLLALLAGLAPVSAETTDSAVRVDLHRRGSTDHLSGVVIAWNQREQPTRVYVLTNAHGFRDGPAETMHVQPPNHPAFKADRVDYCGNPDDSADDLAIVSGPTTRPPPIADLAAEEPTPGTEASLVGYPRGGPLEVRRARLVPSSYVGGLHEYDTPAEEGMSGGPVYVAGRVASLIFGTGADRRGGCMAVPLPRIRNVIRRVFGAPPIPACRPMPGQPMTRQPMPQRPLQPPQNILTAPGGVCTDADGDGVCDAPAGPPGRQSAAATEPWPSPESLQAQSNTQPPRQPAAPAQANPVGNDSDRPLNVVNPVYRENPATDQRGHAAPPPQTQPDAKRDAADPDVAVSVDAHKNPPPPAIDWVDLVAQLAAGAAGAAGIGIPTWLIFAYRASRRAHRLRSGRASRRRSAGRDKNFRQRPRRRSVTRNGATIDRRE